MATLLEILYGSGLRVSELVALPLAAVERDPTMLVVRGKGDKDRHGAAVRSGARRDRAVAAYARRRPRRGRDLALSLSRRAAVPGI